MARQPQLSMGVLSDMCSQVKDSIPLGEATTETYVSTENMVSDKGGIQASSGLPSSGKVIRYKKGDTLVANIRPYFKKIWYAPNDGTCSGDVLVFRANSRKHSALIYFLLRQDAFFDFVMLGAKGTKMPRGDKTQMMRFPIPAHFEDTVLALTTSLVDEISANDREISKLTLLRDALLPKLMSGEIDVSNIELPTQLNSHLADC